MLEKQNQPELAIVFYKKSVNVREGIRQGIQELSSELQESYTQTVAGTYRSLADLLLSQDRILGAQQVLELLKVQELRDYTRNERAGAATTDVVLLPKEEEIIEAYAQLITFAQKIEQCEQTQCDQLSQLRTQRDDLKRQYNQSIQELETAIRQRRGEDTAFFVPEDLGSKANEIIQEQPGTVLIYPLILEDKLWLLWSAQGKVISRREVANFTRQQLNETVVLLRDLLENPSSDPKEIQAKGKQLYDWLIAPIEAELQAGKIQNQEEGIEINGMSYYFLHGGAKAVMASLWKADDASTSELMQRFYRNLAANTPINKAQALRQAQLSMLRNDTENPQTKGDRDTIELERNDAEAYIGTDFSHPYYWAPFILIGNGL